MHKVSLLIALLLLAACEQPAQPVATETASVASVPAAASVLEAAPAQDAPHPAREAVTAALPGKPPAPQKAPALRVLAPPVAPLDLSLPAELLEHWQYAEEPIVVERLLPALFQEQAAPAPFQLSGQLITHDRLRADDGTRVEDEGFLDKIDGAQLNFEFRH